MDHVDAKENDSGFPTFVADWTSFDSEMTSDGTSDYSQVRLGQLVYLPT